jgi:2-amino-4-hydroxy-6-hydroxymethyldihydropteridine diphosphokinase
MSRAYVGLGANLGNPREQVREALRRMAAAPGIRVLAQSALWRSAPLGPAGQPDYCNAACVVETALSPEALLAALHAIERAMGRQRPPERWAPRLIDLDLLHYEGEARSGGGLTLPHPEAHLRNFVMTPLAEVAPGLVLPGAGTVAELARALGQDGLARWELV